MVGIPVRTSTLATGSNASRAPGTIAGGGAGAVLTAEDSI
jgi:hypothetical protein